MGMQWNGVQPEDVERLLEAVEWAGNVGDGESACPSCEAVWSVRTWLPSVEPGGPTRLQEQVGVHREGCVLRAILEAVKEK
jgi:hypothetical protein